MRKTIENKINYFVSVYGEEIRQDLIEEVRVYEIEYSETHDDALPTCKSVCEFLTKYVKEKEFERKKPEYTEEQKAEFANNKKEKLDKAIDMLETGVKEIFESGRFQEYLQYVSRFHTYSFNNQILIMLQNPGAKYVAGFKAWQTKFSRNVKKGEKGILILAPNPVKFTKTIENELGEEEEEEVRIMRFRTVSVFGDNQTEGKEIPAITKKLEFSVKNANAIKEKLIAIAPVPVFFKNCGSANGYFSPSNNLIAIQPDMSEAQTIKTMVHEIAHSMIHCEGGEEETADRETAEVQAESVAYTVLNYLGIDSSDYSFGYVAGWAGGKDLKQLKASLDVISKTAKNIIDKIEEIEEVA